MWTQGKVKSLKLKVKSFKSLFFSLKVLTAVLVVSFGFLFYFGFSANFEKLNPETPFLSRVVQAAASAIKIGKNLDFQNVYTVKGIPWPQQPKDAASKEYVDDVCVPSGPVVTKYIAFIDMGYKLSYIDPDGNIVHTAYSAFDVGGVGYFDTEGGLDIAYKNTNSTGYLKYYDIDKGIGNLSTPFGFLIGAVGPIIDFNGDGDNDIVFSDFQKVVYTDTVGYTNVPLYSSSQAIKEMAGLVKGSGLPNVLFKMSPWGDIYYVNYLGDYRSYPSGVGIDVKRVGGENPAGGVFFVTSDNKLYLTGKGFMNQFALDVGKVADIDGDGKNEVVFVGTDNNLKYMDVDGTNVFSLGIGAKRVGF